MSARPATRRVPAPKAPHVPVRAGNPRWAGHLTRHPVTGDMTGMLEEEYFLGHRLALVGHKPAGENALRLLATVAEMGDVLPPDQDHGLSAALCALGQMHMDLVLTPVSGGWAGALAGDGWRLEVSGRAEQPGRLGLRGRVSDGR